MRVAIIGAREHPDVSIVAAYVDSLPPGDIVITGGALGVDVAAEVACRKSGRRVVVWHPEGPTRRVIGPGVDRVYPVLLALSGPIVGRDAKMLRNTLVAVDCTRMVVFPDGSRGGCWDGAREGRRFHRPVEVRWVDGRVQDYLGGYARRNRPKES